MQVSITARHFDLTPDLKEHAESRLERLKKFASDLLHANVVLDVEKYRQIAEVSVHGGNGNFAGKAETADMFLSIDDAVEKVEKQIRRHARMSRPRDDAKEDRIMGSTRIEAQQVSREMMSVEEATTRVEEGEEIVVFSDTDTGATRVVYRRPDGTMKLIDIAS